MQQILVIGGIKKIPAILNGTSLNIWLLILGNKETNKRKPINASDMQFYRGLLRMVIGQSIPVI